MDHGRSRECDRLLPGQRCGFYMAAPIQREGKKVGGIPDFTSRTDPTSEHLKWKNISRGNTEVEMQQNK